MVARPPQIIDGSYAGDGLHGRVKDPGGFDAVRDGFDDRSKQEYEPEKSQENDEFAEQLWRPGRFDDLGDNRTEKP